MEAIGMDKDHMHILSSSHSKMSPGEIARILKGITGREVFSRKPLLKKELWWEGFGQMNITQQWFEQEGDWKTVEEYILSKGKPKRGVRQLELF